MYLDSIAFKAMEGGLKAMSIKQEVHTQNIANIDTPDYNYKYVTFENALNDASNGKKNYDFTAKITEVENTDVLVDGNNVNVDEEGVELYSAYIQQSAIINKLNSSLSDLKYVMTNAQFK